MTTTQGDLAALSRYVFAAPRWYASLSFALLIAAVAGLAAFDSRFVLEDAWQGVVFIGVPTVVASALTPPVDRRLGGRLTPNRASLLALACELVLVATLVVAGAVALLTPLGQAFVFDALTAGLASVFALRLLVVMAVSRRRLAVAALPASIQTVTAALLVFVYGGTMRYVEAGGPLVRSFLFRPDRGPAELRGIEPFDFLLLLAVCGLYALGVWTFVTVIDRPWRRSLGVSVLDFLSGFIGHVAEGTRELEEFFAALGEEAVVPVTVLSARRLGPAPGDDGADRTANGGGDDATEVGAEKARFVLPMIHPGPMGEIGGGNLPARVATHAEGLAFVPHATAGHDFNLVTEREVGTIIEAASAAAARVDYGRTGTPSRRTRVGDASVVGQRIGDGALLAVSHAPAFADDIDYSVGLSAAAEARAHGLDPVLLIDAHNSNNGLDGPDLGHVVPGSQRSFDVMEAAGTTAAALADAPAGPLALGVAWDETPWEPAEGIGPLGIRAAVFEARGERTAYVLIDGNNIEPGLRGAIVERLLADAGTRAATDDAGPEVAADGAEAVTDGATRAAVDDAEVMTTDTHVVNTIESTNQVGAAIDHDELIALIERLVAAAVADCEPVAAGLATERCTVTVFGNDRTETLASHANALISMGGALAVAVTLALLSISMVVFFLT